MSNACQLLLVYERALIGFGRGKPLKHRNNKISDFPFYSPRDNQMADE